MGLGDNEPLRRAKGEGTGWYLSGHGYLVREAYDAAKTGGRKRRLEFQHRVVMEEMLGRPLEKFENVHHLNGVRDDNRPENLELWVSMQPSGQRVSDLLAWAEEIINRYGKGAQP